MSVRYTLIAGVILDLKNSIRKFPMTPLECLLESTMKRMDIMAAKAEYKIEKKRNGRYAVRIKGTAKTVNGEEKVKVLLEKGLIKTGLAKAKKEEN